MGNAKTKINTSNVIEYCQEIEDLVRFICNGDTAITSRGNTPLKADHKKAKADKEKFFSQFSDPQRFSLDMDTIQSKSSNLLNRNYSLDSNVDYLIMLFISTLNNSDSKIILQSFYWNIYNNSFNFFNYISFDFKHLLNSEYCDININTTNQINISEIQNKMTDVDLQEENFSKMFHNFLNNLLNILRLIFKDKELNMCFHYFDDIIIHLILFFMIINNIHSFKSVNEVTLSFFIFDKRPVDNDKHIQFAIISNLLNFLLLKHLCQNISFKKLSLVFLESENKVFNREFRFPSKFNGEYEKIIKKFSDKLNHHEEFNNNLISYIAQLLIHFKYIQIIKELNIIFIMEKISISKLLGNTLNANEELRLLKKTQLRLYLINDYQNDINLIDYFQHFQYNKNFLSLCFQSKTFDEVHIILNKGIYHSMYGSSSRNSYDRIHLVNKLQSLCLNELKDDKSKLTFDLLINYADHFLEYLEDLLLIVPRIKIEVDTEMNDLLKKTRTHIDLLNKEVITLKQVKIDFYLNGNRKAFLDEITKNDFQVDPDLIYLINPDKRKSVYTSLSDNLARYLEDNHYFIEFRLSKENLSSIINNEETCQDISEKLQLFDYKMLNRLLRKFNKNEGVFMCLPILMKHICSLLSVMRPTGSIPQLKDLLSEMFSISKGCGLLVVLINSNLFQISHTEILIKLIIKKFRLLNNNEIFFSIYSDTNMFIINTYIHQVKKENTIKIIVNFQSSFVDKYITHKDKDPISNGDNPDIKMIEEFFYSYGIVDQYIKKYKQNYKTVEYSFFLKDKGEKGKSLVKLTIEDNVYHLSFPGYEKKNLSKNILIVLSSLMRKLHSKNAYKCNKFDLDLEKFLIKKEGSYMDIINIFMHVDKNRSNVINVSNHNYSLLSKNLLQDDFIRNNFTLGNLNVIDANLFEVLLTILDNDYQFTHVDFSYEKTLNNFISIEKISGFNSCWIKFKQLTSEGMKSDRLTMINNNYNNLYKKLLYFHRIPSVSISFNSLSHSDFLQELYLIENLMTFLKTFFDNITLKGKAIANKEVTSNQKLNHVLPFKNDKYTQDIDKLLFTFKMNNSMSRLIIKREIIQRILSFLLVKRYVKLERHSSRNSNILYF